MSEARGGAKHVSPAFPCFTPPSSSFNSICLALFFLFWCGDRTQEAGGLISPERVGFTLCFFTLIHPPPLIAPLPLPPPLSHGIDGCFLERVASEGRGGEGERGGAKQKKIAISAQAAQARR